MSSIVYLIIDKLKRDILHELSSICTDENELKEVLDLYFKEYDLILSLPKKSSEVYRDRKKYDLKENRCLARVWNTGMGGQCSFTGEYNGFCKAHAEPKGIPGGQDWWLGTINKPRPERPIKPRPEHPLGDKIHIWKE